MRLFRGWSFSWRRACGLSVLKYRWARRTGIPTTRSGLERKIGRAILRPLFFWKWTLLWLAGVAAVTILMDWTGRHIGAPIGVRLFGAWGVSVLAILRVLRWL